MHVYVQKKCISEKRKQSLQAKTKTKEISIFKGQKDIILLREAKPLGNGRQPTEKEAHVAFADVNPTELHNEAQDPGSNSSPRTFQERTQSYQFLH